LLAILALLPLSDKLLLLDSMRSMLERLHMLPIDGKFFLGCTILEPKVDHSSLE
jgi:hypothetical protein